MNYLSSQLGALKRSRVHGLQFLFIVMLISLLNVPGMKWVAVAVLFFKLGKMLHFE